MKHPDWHEFITDYRQTLPSGLFMTNGKDPEGGPNGDDDTGDANDNDEDEEIEVEVDGEEDEEEEESARATESALVLKYMPNSFPDCDETCRKDIFSYGLPLNYTLLVHNKTDGPVWRLPIFIRAAFILADGGISRWTIENKVMPVSTDCHEKEGVQYYLRTHQHDDICRNPINLLGLNTTYGLPPDVECIPCPDGGSCNSPGKYDVTSGVTKDAVGVLLWNVAPRQGYWRIPWARKGGDYVSEVGEDRELMKSPPYWFHKCPRKEACLGVLPDDRFGGNGWESSADTPTSARLNILAHINNGSSWSCLEPLPLSQCLNGTTGPLCAMCANAFIRFKGKCVKCYDQDVRFKVLIAVMIVVFLICIIIRSFVRRLKSNGLAAIRDVSRIAVIVIGMCQIITTIPNLVEVDWPDNVVEFLEYFDIVNFDIASLTGATCDNRINFHVQFGVMAICPPIIVIVAVLTYWVQHCKIGRRVKSMMKQYNEAENKRKLRNQILGELNNSTEDVVMKDEVAQKHEIALQQCYVDLFKVIDADNSGDVNAVEMLRLLRLLGYKDRRINEAITLRLIHRMAGTMQVDKIPQHLFVDEVQTGQLTLRLRDLMNLKETNVDHSEIILKWNDQRKLVSYSFSWAMQLLVLFHTPVSRKVFQFFDCVKIGPPGNKFMKDYSQSFLRSDFSIQCKEGGVNVPSYSSFMPYVLSCCVLFTCLLPMACAIFLICKRKKLYDPKSLMRMGWMYNRLKHGSEWWGVHEIIRKLLLCGVIVFFPSDPGLRASIALVVCIVSQSLLNYFEPHRNRLVFWTENLAMTVVVLLYSFALVLRADLNKYQKDNLGGVVIAAIILIMIAGIGTSIGTLAFVRNQILLDDANILNTSIIFKRAMLKVRHHKKSIHVQNRHEITSAAKVKKVQAKQISAKERLAKRLNQRQPQQSLKQVIIMKKRNEIKLSE